MFKSPVTLAIFHFIIAYSDIQLIAINVLGLMIQITFFAYGLVNAIKGTLSPKRMGAIIAAYFVSMCITSTNNISSQTNWQIAIRTIVIIIPSVVGGVASYFYFMKEKNNKIYPLLISAASIYGMLSIGMTFFEVMLRAGRFMSMNTTLGLLLKVSIYGLILYQTYVFGKKRKNAIEVCEQ